jgi:ABC-2 type transport system permease protein
VIRLLWEVGRRSFRLATTYRLATASGVFINTVFGYLRAAILVFVARTAGGEVNGMTEADLATFSFVSQGFLMIVGAFGHTELSLRIRKGDVVVDLYRPVDLQLWELANWLGNSAFQVLARGVPPILLGAIAFDLVWPTSWQQWLAFAASTVLASIVGMAVRFCSALTAFWLLDNRGIEQLLVIAISFFAGLLLPINLFPDWLAAVARATPFASMIQLPVEIYLGQHDGWAMVSILAQQALWVVLLVMAGRVILAAATRKVVIQGG